MPARSIRDDMQMGPGMRQAQVQRPVVNQALPPVPARPQPTMGQVGAPIYNPSGPQPQVMSGGMPVTAPVVAPKPVAGPMPAPVGGGIGGSMGNVGQPQPGQAPAVATTGMPPGQLPMARR